MMIKVKSSTWVYDHYKGYSLRMIRSLLERQYARWVGANDPQTRIDAWAYVKGLVAVARERGAFNEKTWEVDV